MQFVALVQEILQNYKRFIFSSGFLAVSFGIFAPSLFFLSLLPLLLWLTKGLSLLRAELAQQQEVRQKSEKLLETLKKEKSPIFQLSTEELELILKIALECRQLFQRSSSCVEGRNGQLSLRHHSLHRIGMRDAPRNFSIWVDKQ